MSVIQEAQPRDELVSIQEFNASPKGEPFSWDTSHRFRIGDRVRYVNFVQDAHFQDHPGLGWMVIFETANGKRYTATHTYFVTGDCWNSLKKFFAKRLLREPRHKASHL